MSLKCEILTMKYYSANHWKSNPAMKLFEGNVFIFSWAPLPGFIVKKQINLLHFQSALISNLVQFRVKTQRVCVNNFLISWHGVNIPINRFQWHRWRTEETFFTFFSGTTWQIHSTNSFETVCHLVSSESSWINQSILPGVQASQPMKHSRRYNKQWPQMYTQPNC